MQIHFQRNDGQNGKLTIVFTNPAHLADSFQFTRDEEKSLELNTALIWLIRMAMGGSLPRRPLITDDGTTIEGVIGKDRTITISPDGRDVPSFLWFEEGGMHGGLIYHQSSGDWSVHT